MTSLPWHEFFEYLARLGLLEDRLEKALWSWQPTRVSALLDDLEQMFPPFESHPAQGQYSFIANTGLSGGTSPCSSRECRVKHADELGRFAALYADHVLIRDPFEGLYHLDFSLGRNVSDLTNGLFVLYHLRPLLEVGLIHLASGTYSVCRECFRELLEGSGIVPKRYSRARRVLGNRFVREVRGVLRRFPEATYVELVESDDAFLEHGKGMIEISRSLELFSHRRPGSRLSASELRKTGAVAGYVDQLVDDVVLQKFYSHHFGVTALTDRSADLDVIGELNGSEENRISRALLHGLTHDLPIIRQAQLAEVLKLRMAEGEAFEVYRDKVRGLLKHLKNPTPTQAREAFLDVVQPELNKIDKAIKDSRKLWRASLVPDLASVAAVCIALFGGFRSPTLQAVLAAMGGKHLLDRASQKAVERIREPVAATENEYYFLWKVRQRARKGRPRFIVKTRD